MVTLSPRNVRKIAAYVLWIIVILSAISAATPLDTTHVIGVVTSADHETAEGYFTICVDPTCDPLDERNVTLIARGALRGYLTNHRGQKIVISFREHRGLAPDALRWEREK